MSFDFVNNGNYRNTGMFGAPVPNNSVPVDGYGIPIQQYQQPVQQQPINYNFGNGAQQQQQQRPMIDPRLYDTPNIVTNNNSFRFSVKDDNNSRVVSDIHVDEPITPETRRRGNLVQL